MKVGITTTTYVELTGDAIKQAFEKHLDDLCGGEGVYIDDKGRVKEWEDTGHGSGITDDVKNPSKRQVAALKFRRALHEIKMEEYKEEEKARRKKK